jgi:hypothetical protein
MIKLEDIQYRIGSKNAKGVTYLVYIDARTARKELDRRYGQGYWQFECTLGKDAVHGTLKVYNKELGEWVTYQDVGYNDNTDEPLKGGVSDALKRCAVHVGIGAFLYDAPFLWVPIDGLNGNRLNPDAEKILQGKIANWYNDLFPNKLNNDIRQFNK